MYETCDKTRIPSNSGNTYGKSTCPGGVFLQIHILHWYQNKDNLYLSWFKIISFTLLEDAEDVVVADRYKISSLVTEDVYQGGWSTQLIFFAFPRQTEEQGQRKYYVDSTNNPYRHRVLTDGEDREIGGESGWKAELEFWAFADQKPMTQKYTVLYKLNPYGSQIMDGNVFNMKGWKVHSVFWAYLSPGNHF